MNKWYVVQVMSAHEKKVKKGLEEGRELKGMTEYIKQVVLPIENVSEVKQGKQRVVEKRLWPGYLLLEMNFNDDTWQYVKNTPGVIGFLGGDQPTPLTQREVDEILKDLEEKSKRVVQRHKFQVGDKVKIIDGVFINFIGTVIEVFHDKGTLSALVSIFGRDTRIDDLEFVQVEEITDESDK